MKKLYLLCSLFAAACSAEVAEVAKATPPVSKAEVTTAIEEAKAAAPVAKKPQIKAKLLKKKPAPQACESFYTQGVDDSLKAIIDSYQTRSITTEHVKLIRQGFSGDEVRACIVCGSAVAREGLKIIRKMEAQNENSK